jgi:hypothetical protein
MFTSFTLGQSNVNVVNIGDGQCRDRVPRTTTSICAPRWSCMRKVVRPRCRCGRWHARVAATAVIEPVRGVNGAGAIRSSPYGDQYLGGGLVRSATPSRCSIPATACSPPTCRLVGCGNWGSAADLQVDGLSTVGERSSWLVVFWSFLYLILGHVLRLPSCWCVVTGPRRSRFSCSGIRSPCCAVRSTVPIWVMETASCWRRCRGCCLVIRGGCSS